MVTIDTGESKVPVQGGAGDHPDEQQRGSCSASTCDLDAGMLFISEAPRHALFWMKNTLIPLDMIFISADRRIAGIVENAEPKTLSARRSPALISSTFSRSAAAVRRVTGSAPGQLVDFKAVPASRTRRVGAMQPMLAVQADAPLSDPDLVYELKYDGIRALVTVTPARGRKRAQVAIASRAGNDKSAQFPEVVHALSVWGAGRSGAALLDGEIVALDADGQPTGFQRIQDRIHLTDPREIVTRAAANPIAFVAFDLLRDGDADLCALPLVERRRRLEAALAPALDAVIRLSTQVRGDGAALLAEARARGWEGLVVKDAQSPYRPGRRSREWRKLKLVRRDSFVIGGFTEPRGARAGFGALLVGLPQEDGRLRFAGHVGGGFSDDELDRVSRRLAALEIASCPFVKRPVTNEKPHWTRPVLVAEVRYFGVTDEGVLRAPIYLGLRDDLTSGPSRVRTSRDELHAAKPRSARRDPRRTRFGRQATDPGGNHARARADRRARRARWRHAAARPTAACCRSRIWPSGCGRGWRSRRPTSSVTTWTSRSASCPWSAIAR